MSANFFFKLTSILFLIIFMTGCGGSGNSSPVSFKLKTKPSDIFSDPNLIALCKAAMNNDIREIDRLISAGTNINAQGKDGYTAIYFALHPGGKNTFLAMLEHGADPNIQVTTSGECLILLVAKSPDDSDWLEMVLNHGGDPDAEDPTLIIDANYTPIYKAIFAGNLKSVKLLIKAGANINHQS